KQTIDTPDISYKEIWYPCINRIINVVTGARLINKMALIGCKICTPLFQLNSANKPGKVIINNIWYFTVQIALNSGTSIFPNALNNRTKNKAVNVPVKQLNVEYRRTDQPENSLPPIVYNAHPSAASNKIIILMNLAACNNTDISPFVTTKTTPTKSPIIQRIVNKNGFFLNT